jgi:CRISPR-associated protein Cmr4
MFPQELSEICVFYCITPLHAGSGQALGAVDLPIQRERHTGWPQVQASGVKGAFRDWFQKYYEANGAACENKGLQAQELTNRVFGKEEGKEESGGQAGAVSVSDARLLAFPVRSNIAPFVWVTCPAVLRRFRRDAEICGIDLPVPVIEPSSEDSYLCVTGNVLGSVVLEDLAVSNQESGNSAQDIKDLSQTIQKLAPSITQLVLIPDQHFSFLVRTATEIQPQIRIDMATGTADDGSLRYQELLPSDTVMYSAVFFARERADQENGLLAPEVIRDCVKTAISSHIRMGGDMTLGRGIMQVSWNPGENQ